MFTNKFYFLLAIVALTYSTPTFAVNVQQYSRSNSLTFEMIEDARLSSSHVINHYKWLFNLGVSYVDQPLVIKNSENTEQLDSIVDSMRSLHLGAAYYIKPYWQIAMNTSVSHFENNLDQTFTDFQDIDIRTKLRLYNGRLDAFTVMPTASIPLKGGETEIRNNATPPESYGRDQLLSDTGFGLGLFAIYERLFRHFQVSLNLGYRYNSEAKFVDTSGTTQIDKTQVLTAGFGIYYPFHKKVGLNVEFLSNHTAPFFNSNVNPSEIYVGLSTGLLKNIHAFAGAGFGNFFSSIDGNDYRIVAGLKLTPGTKPKKDYSQLKQVVNIKPERIIEDQKGFCDGAYLFKNTNSVTVLFPNDSSTISKKQQGDLLKIMSVYNKPKLSRDF